MRTSASENTPSPTFVNRGKKEAGAAESSSLLDRSSLTLTASVP
jgi:hypothetical protein